MKPYPFETLLVEPRPIRWPGLKRIAAAAGTIVLCIIFTILVMCL